MKKLFTIFALLTVFASGLFAQNVQKKDESKWSKITYQNVPILKCLDSKEAYIVIYQKNKIGTGSVVVPKNWSKGTPEQPRKLKFRKVPSAKKAYMTVVKNDGEFSRVILSMPMNKSDSIWGVADYHKQIEGADKDTLEELEF